MQLKSLEKTKLYLLTKAAELFNIPQSTLQDHLSNAWEKKIQKIGRKDHNGAGRPREIDEDSEDYLVEGLQYLGSMGWPVEPSKVPLIIKFFLDNLGVQRRFANNLP